MTAKRLLVGVTLSCLTLLGAGLAAAADQAAPQVAGAAPACQSLEAPGVPAALQLSGTICGSCPSGPDSFSFTSPGCEKVPPGGACANNTKTCRVVLPVLYCHVVEQDIVKCACV